MAVSEKLPRGSEHHDAASSHQEIERKFFVATLHENLSDYPATHIRQGYLSVTSTDEIRIRQAGDRFFQTTKSTSGLVRSEEEVEIAKDIFEEAWPLTEGKRLEKIRYKIPDDTKNIIYEVDLYQGDLVSLPPVVEIEFKTIDEANTFTPPDWIGTELTGNPDYQNSALATRGIPKDLDSITGTGKKESLVVEGSLQKDIERLVDMVIEKKAELDRPLILGLAGRTSAGKSTVIEPITARANELGLTVTSLPMDDYSLGNEHIRNLAAKGITINWDHPLYMDFDSIKKDVETLKKGQPIQKPTFSFVTGERDRKESFSPADIIIVEGLFANRPEIADSVDLKAFIDISLHGSLIRRLMRDIHRTNMSPSEIIRYYLETVEPMYQEHIVQTKTNADIVLVNEYNPHNESERAGTYEVQTKFKTKIDKEILRRAGAEFLGVVHQHDFYFTPKDRDLQNSGESLRIRKEDGVSVLSYKGPERGEKVRVRPKFEFEIDDTIEQNLLKRYGDTVLEIIKIRRLYKVNDTIVTQDEVGTGKDGVFTSLGSFIEVRCEKEKYEEQIKKVCEELDLNPKEKINTSYTEMKLES